MIDLLTISTVRNIISASLQVSPHLNVIYGENGSGKTSLLEAIHLLSTLNSFRSSKPTAAISHNAEKFTISAKLVDKVTTLGVERYLDGDSQMKVSGNSINSVSELSSYLPVIVIDTQALQLIDGAPDLRRKFINKGLFYTLDNFTTVWGRYTKILRHRNSILKQPRVDIAQLDIWDVELAKLAEQIAQFSRDYIAQLEPIFASLLANLIVLPNLKITYYAGWSQHKEYIEALVEAREHDIARGFTSYGIHRADLKISIDGHNASEALSRGQKKIFVSALMLAQGILLQQVTKRSHIFLVDDLAAELDEKNIQKLCKLLADSSAQTFITSINKTRYSDYYPDNIETAYFAISNGEITCEDNR